MIFISWSLMTPNRPKLASQAKKTWALRLFLIFEYIAQEGHICSFYQVVGEVQGSPILVPLCRCRRKSRLQHRGCRSGIHTWIRYISFRINLFLFTTVGAHNHNQNGVMGIHPQAFIYPEMVYIPESVTFLLELIYFSSLQLVFITIIRVVHWWYTHSHSITQDQRREDLSLDFINDVNLENLQLWIL